MGCRARPVRAPRPSRSPRRWKPPDPRQAARGHPRSHPSAEECRRRRRRSCTRSRPIRTSDNKPKVDPQEALKSGLQQYARGDTSAALASFRSALSANPGFSPAYRGMGLVYEKMGNKAQARIAYKKYLALAPTAGDADQIRERMERL